MAIVIRARWIYLAAGLLAVLLASAVYRLWPRPLESAPRTMIPVWERIGNRDVLRQPDRFLIADIAQYDNELFAFMMFTYMRARPPLDNAEFFLTYRRQEHTITYVIQAELPNDLLAAVEELSTAEVAGLIDRGSWRFVTKDSVERLREETRLFQAAYNLPIRQKLEDLSRTQLIAYIRRFVRFKSMTDPRIRRKLKPIPEPLTSKEARQLAEDIVAVADFYSIPLDFFLGIGAMENNYMNVEGDLRHAIWKRRLQRGDVVLKRKGGRFLVLNSALGVWQITRETLRYAHRRYLQDHRDYSRLPARLRPPKVLNFDDIEPEVLTTYAGLLFRDLLDRCQGDVHTAVGAYNGGIGNPNARYAEGVKMVADYARRLMEHAAVLNGPVAEMQFRREDTGHSQHPRI